MFQAMLSIFTDLNVPYMLADKSLVHMWLNCSVGNQALSFQIYLPWWRNNRYFLKHGMKKRGFDLKRVFGKLTQSFGYQEVWRYHGKRVNLFSNIYEEDYNRVGLWVGKDCYPCYMKVIGIARYEWLGGVSVLAPFPLEEALQSAYGPMFQKNDPNPFVFFCLGTKAKQT